jgi:hypothetical protein
MEPIAFTSVVERLMLGIEPPQGRLRQNDLTEFLRGVSRRREPNFHLAQNAIRNGHPSMLNILQTFTHASADVIVTRVKEIMSTDPDPKRALEIMQLLTKSTTEQEDRTSRLVQQTTKLRENLAGRALKSTPVKRCLRVLEQEASFNDRRTRNMS